MTLTDLVDEISPFPGTGTLLYDDHRRSSPEQLVLGSNIHSSSSSATLPPLQKLRPIRSVAADPTTSTQGGDISPPNDEPELPLFSEFCGYIPNNNGESEQTAAGGTRWVEEEALALLKVCIEMNPQFKDYSNLKGKLLLWENVSKKLEQMGYKRDGRKCREKFENVYKYYRRIKERLKQGGRVKDPRIYKFFSELEALDVEKSGNFGVGSPPPNELVCPQVSSDDLFSVLASSGYEKYEEDEVEVEVKEKEVVGHGKRKRKRKSKKELRCFMESLVDKLMMKQEEMHMQLIEMIDRKEKERMDREEAWKKQAMEREKREREMRAQETSRSISLISFIAKFLGEEIQIPEFPERMYVDVEEDPGVRHELVNYEPVIREEVKHGEEEQKFDSSSKRWPRGEVQALITLRTAMDLKFRNGVLKNPIWEEISAAMSTMGYIRSAKKCKEKWENINKYFKKTLVSGKKRRENAKTCPYFRELSVLYRSGIIGSGAGATESNNESDAQNTEQILESAAVCNLISMSQNPEAERVHSSTPHSDTPHD